MLIGGDFYKHGGCGIESSWLFTESPEKYLIKEEDLLASTGCIINFLLGAIKAKISNFILEIPWILDEEMRSKKESIIIKNSQNPIIYFKRYSDSWKEAKNILEISWNDIPDQWDENWFKSFIKSNIEREKKKALFNKQTAENNIKKYDEILSEI